MLACWNATLPCSENGYNGFEIKPLEWDSTEREENRCSVIREWTETTVSKISLFQPAICKWESKTWTDE